MEALNVVVRFTADVNSMVRGATEASRAVDGVSDAEDRVARSAATAAAGTATLSFEFNGLADDAQTAKRQIDQLNGALTRTKFMRGGGLFGGTNVKGIATDTGSAIRSASNLAQGLLGALTLIAPTINIIIAALVGVVSLLGAGLVAAVAFAAALAATAGAMALAAYKWRDLLAATTKGAETWRGAMSAVEGQAYTMVQGVVASFTKAGKAGTDMWQSIGEAGVKFLRMMQPVVDAIVGKIQNFVAAFSGDKGASSPLLDFLRTWIAEWKKLGAIINEGVEGGGGLLGFFQKYEAPAKAFVEGIAQVINAVRKMSAMGLGLNMKQLAELIHNVFAALANLVQFFPKFSNSLVMVGLEVSRFITAMLPIIDAAINIGAAILQNIVAPLVNGFLVAVQKVMSVPFIGWLASVAGGLALTAAALAKLTFNQLTFTKVLGGMVSVLKSVSAAVGNLIINFVRLNLIDFGPVSAGVASLAGGIAIVAALAAAYFLLKGAFNEVAAAAKKSNDAFEAGFKKALDNTGSLQNLAHDTQNELAAAHNNLSNIGTAVYAVQNLWNVYWHHMDGTAITVAKTLEMVKGKIGEIADAAGSDVLSGFLSPEDIQGLKLLQEAALTPGGNYEIALEAATKLNDVMQTMFNAYKDGTINAGQYATMMEQLGQKVDVAGDKIDYVRLKVIATGNTIAEALKKVQDAGAAATGSLEQFALSSGQSFTSLRDQALTAMNDVQGGLLGTGEKVNEFFMQQATVIEDWKATAADSFNTVKTALAGLATGAKVTFATIKSTLEGAVQDLLDYKAGWNDLKDLGASQELLRQIEALGPAGAQLVAGIVSGGKKGVQEVNKLVKQGVDVSSVLADNFATTLGVTMDKLVTSIELMMSRSLGIPFRQVQARVEHLVGGVNNATGKLKDRVVNISLNTRLSGKATGFAPGPGGAPAFSGTKGTKLPGPDSTAVAKQYRDLGKVGATSFALGLGDGGPVMQTAAAALGTGSVKATADAIGAHSPATEFISIGEDAVNGLILGLQSSGPRLTMTAYRLGESVVNGLQAGIDKNMNALLASVASQIGDIIQMFVDAIKPGSPSKVFYKLGASMGDGLRFGLRDSLQRMKGDMPGHIRDLQKDWPRGGHLAMSGRNASAPQDNRPLRVSVVLDRRQFGKDLGSEYQQRGW